MEAAARAEEVKTGVPLRLRLLQEVARVSDGYSEVAQELATAMEEAREGSRLIITQTQMRSLENVAYTTPKVSDIFDLIKKQIGRGLWPVEIGDGLLAALGQRQAEARRIAQVVDPQDSDLSRRTYLLLCREFIKHLAAHFIYQRKLHGREEEEQ